MKLYQQILTNNDCYKAGRKIVVKGLMLHSTGANNPKISRYVQPDDGILGDNPNNNDWNQPGISKLVHAFIGKVKDGSIATYQTLPWNHRAWGGGGRSNDTHIHVEICEDDLKDPAYFKAVYKEAVELFAYLCRELNLDPDRDIITHCEGFKLGIASNHGDVMHWFPKHGKSMNTFRADVKAELSTISVTPPLWNGYPLKEGQIGLLEIVKDINLWSRDADNNLTMIRVLKAGEYYRVYGYDNLHGGQYNVGGAWVTNMEGHVVYRTPSKETLQQAVDYYAKH